MGVIVTVGPSFIERSPVVANLWGVDAALDM